MKRLITITTGALLLTIGVGRVRAAVDSPSSNWYASDSTLRTQSKVFTEIRAMLDSGAAAWNRGDLDRFVEDFAADTTTTFIGSKGVIRGRPAIRAVYAPRFAPGGTRDSLSFENLEVDELGKNLVHVIAYYRLTRGTSTTARGPTSLVMRKIGGRWLIIHDHSS